MTCTRIFHVMILNYNTITFYHLVCYCRFKQTQFLDC